VRGWLVPKRTVECDPRLSSEESEKKVGLPHVYDKIGQVGAYATLQCKFCARITYQLEIQ
jgi:hypothetical protein